jgi:hypothetical protein
MRPIILGTFVGLLAALVARAAVPQSSPKELMQEATDVVVGKVTEIYTSISKEKESEEVRIVAQVEIQKVEKGELKSGDLVYARYWESKWLGKTPPPPDGSMSFSPAPKKGQKVRVYLGRNVQNGLGEQKDGGYNVLLPNGFEILKSK